MSKYETRLWINGQYTKPELGKTYPLYVRSSFDLYPSQSASIDRTSRILLQALTSLMYQLQVRLMWTRQSKPHKMLNLSGLLLLHIYVRE